MERYTEMIRTVRAHVYECEREAVPQEQKGKEGRCMNLKGAGAPP